VGNLTLGRQGSNQDEDLALCLLTVDGQVPAEALDKLEALGNVHEVRTATL
jgi:predicted ATPase with chaperone activity